jgi:hypothetical protein
VLESTSDKLNNNRFAQKFLRETNERLGRT